jgi:glutathione synthase/RimK-type ligase-like ATP-grasp enzyme
MSREGRAFLRGIYESLSDVPWISPLYQILRAENKLWQLDVAKSMGLSVPDSIVTNDPIAAKGFIERNRPVVVKPLSSGMLDEQHISFTNELIDWDPSLSEEIALGPHFFQLEVVKAADVRVTVVDRVVFACRILSQSRENTRVDFRRFEEDIPEHQIVELPQDLQDRLVSLVKNLGLRFGAIDLVEDRNGHYWFLEINPSGQWGWIEQLTGVPIADTIVSALSAENVPA